ncbi:efflux RND transporter permease subunit [Paludibaculum fermentans]|uniref:Efflux RND transporter permease subunit n=1 Tax=Paludibaculum fermentans TaxID=1473598 RepID=A0A7S7SKY6_PALFE|nr:CusA/CzcA family heavy metal efflux RND transporter [Paludibaculum fermentans]QOY87535.1 efflux RND transporter permease subunit [Paludibaculum fermentans]
MIDRIIDFSARRRGTVAGGVLALAMWGCWSMGRIPLDALPDLGETQVILYSRWDRSPDLIEDQVTYPIVTAMLGAPKVKAVRGISDFGYSFVYVIFEDGTDLYWARSRTQEYLAGAISSLPPGVRTELGPDATSLGWIYQYAVTDASGKRTPAELRSTQDFFLRYHLRSVPGVAEVAAVGGFTSQYQVTVDPARLRALGLPMSKIVEAVRRSNIETGGRLLEFGGSEYMVRGRGYLKNPEDLEEVVVSDGEGTGSVRLKDVGTVARGPEIRRGLADLNGRGETVSGIVIMRQGANALDVIRGVKMKLEQIQTGLPAGVRIVPVYDRSELIGRVIDNLRTTLLEIAITVAVVVLLFLWHPASAIIPILTIPLTVLAVAGPFHLLGLSWNVMSLGGIAIATGALVDAAIVVVEQTHKRLEEWQEAGSVGDQDAVIVRAMKEVARPAFFALLIMAVAFLPVFALDGQEGRLFHPLAYAKSLTMLIAAFLTITLDPALRLMFARLGRRHWHGGRAGRCMASLLSSRVRNEEHHPLSRTLIRLYEPALIHALNRKGIILAAILAAAALTAPLCWRLGSEFMPPLDEGVLLYMPSTVASISIAQAKRLVQLTDARLRRMPEIAQVLGKAGRADTATDIAPLSMLETVVVLKPREQWPEQPTWYTSWAPAWLKPLFRRITSDRMSQKELIGKLDTALRLPGIANSWTMPIRGRIDMLATGMRSPLGLKISGADLQVIQDLGAQAEEVLRPVAGTRSVFAERVNDGRYVDIDWDRRELAAAGINMEDAQVAVENSIGGENVTTVIQGRARYPVNVRLPRDWREDLDALRRVPVSGGEGSKSVPLGQLARVQTTQGPAMIRDENGLLTGYVYIDLEGRDPQEYVAEAEALLGAKLKLPGGYTLLWSGQYESYQRLSQRLRQVVPLTLLLIAILLYWNTGSLGRTALVLLAVPFSAIGAIWSLYLLGYPMSPAVWVGMIALLGVDAETGTFMVMYLDLAYEARKASGRLRTRSDLRQAILGGAVRRIRPKFMTVATMFIGLVPVLWSTGTGSEVMKRIAAPMVGGLASSFLIELIVYPVLYDLWKSRQLPDAGAFSGGWHTPPFEVLAETGHTSVSHSTQGAVSSGD